MADELSQIERLRAEWVFNGAGGQFPAGVFPGLAKTEAWIAKHRLSGIATLYHVDDGACGWSIKNGLFAEKAASFRTRLHRALCRRPMAVLVMVVLPGVSTGGFSQTQRLKQM